MTLKRLKWHNLGDNFFPQNVKTLTTTLIFTLSFHFFSYSYSHPILILLLFIFLHLCSSSSIILWSTMSVNSSIRRNVTSNRLWYCRRRVTIRTTRTSRNNGRLFYEKNPKPFTLKNYSNGLNTNNNVFEWYSADSITLVQHEKTKCNGKTKLLPLLESTDCINQYWRVTMIDVEHTKTLIVSMNSEW